MMTSSDLLADARLVTHEAMNTTFALRLRGLDDETARGLMSECIHRIDSLEARLSRFIDGSDVSRINRMEAGETLYLSEECHQCLLLALDAYVATAGLFDITLGRRIEHRKAASDEPLPPVLGRLTIHPDVPAVTCEEAGREIDLGGIGKGFALDQLKRFLDEWGVEDALLAAGASSLLGIGPQSWPVDLAGDGGALRIQLVNESLSASGTGIQGSHIVHPGGDDFMPVRSCRRVWATAETAAMAEVWSTALMLVEADEIPAWVESSEGIGRVFVEIDGAIRSIRGI